MQRWPFIVVASLLALSAPACACSKAQPEVFGNFMAQFIMSMDFALTRASFPLPASRLDMHAGPEPIVKPYRLTREAFKTAGTIGAQEKRDGLKTRQHAVGPRSAELHVHKPDTGWLVVYHFHLRNNCWHLRRMEDQSS